MTTRKRAVSALTLALCLGLGVPMGVARAADLGGDCCADLEERVAELEATAARKGNRTVSLTINGQISRGLLFWDDGVDSDAYVVDNAINTSRFAFEGQAAVAPGVTAGYALLIDVNDGLSSIVSQVDPDGSGPVPGGDEGFGESSIDIRVSKVYIGSERLGKISIGHDYSFNGAVSVPLQVANTYNTDGGPYADGFNLRTPDGALTALTWGRLIGNGPRRNDYLRYDSPDFGGFGFTAAIGDDDIVDLGARYFTRTDRLQLHTAINYYDYDAEPLGSAGLLDDFQELKGLVSVKDLPTGLFLTLWAAQRDYARSVVTANGLTFEDTGHSIQAFVGIEKPLTPYGTTTLYGGYGRFENLASTGLTAAAIGLGVGGDGSGDDFVSDAKIDRLTFGVVQGFDAAGLEVYGIVEHYSADVSVGDVGSDATASADLEDYFAVIVGSRLKF